MAVTRSNHGFDQLQDEASGLGSQLPISRVLHLMMRVVSILTVEVCLNSLEAWQYLGTPLVRVSMQAAELKTTHDAGKIRAG